MARFTALRIFALALVVPSAMAGQVCASVITTGNVVPGGANTQSDPWAVGDSLKVGDSGNGTLNVEAAGMVSNTAGYIGYHSGSTGEATVTGTSSLWNNTGNLHVGVAGDGTLNVKAGGVVSNSTGRIGDQSGSTGKATVTGSSSQWNNSDRLVVGRSGDGTLIVEAEGVVSNNLGLIGRYSSSKGVVTVTGASSQWNNSGALHVGWYGDGTLNVNVGGMASNTSGYIGRYSGSTGMATVTGADSQWSNSNSLYIGGGSSGAGGSGTLNLNNSGLVTVSGTTKLWSDGTIILNGGTLDAGVLDLTLGTFNMLDGRLHADSVVGDINVQGGTVAPGHSPGILSISGNYVQGAAATLEIELGGTENGEYDRLLVTGTLTLSGTLEVQLLDGFFPTIDTGFHIFDATDLSGTFSTVVLPDLSGNLDWDSSHLYNSGTLFVIPEPTTLLLLAVGTLLLCHKRRRHQRKI